MKFVRVEEKQLGPLATARLRDLRGRSFSEWWATWYIQAALFVLVFALGAVVYRSGIVRPVTAYLHALAGPGPLVNKMPEPVKEAEQNVQDEVRMYVDNGLPTLYIDLPFKNYQKLLDKRNEALKIGILNTTDADFVQGQVHLQDGPKMDTKLRLKGDWTDHLTGDKWSFRFQMKGDGQILGMSQFNIQTPESRNFLNEWAFHQVLMKEGILTTRYQFVNVLLNGKLLGIYAIEEHFAPELIESQGRRQGLILRYNEDLMWNNMTTFWSNGINQESNLAVTNSLSAEINAFQENKLVKDPTLAAETKTASDLLRAYQSGQRPASEVFDVELWGRFFALTDLWDAGHGIAWHNLRFYYNPVTARLEPVAYDTEPYQVHDTQASIIDQFVQNRIFNDPQIRAAYAHELERVTTPEYVAAMKSDITPQHDRLLSALKVEYPLSVEIPQKSVIVDWVALTRRAKALHLELQPADVVRGSYQAMNVLRGATGKPTLTLDLVNLMLFPLNVNRVEVNGHAIQLGDQQITLPMVVDPQKPGFEPTHISIPLSGSEGLGQDSTLDVKVVVGFAGIEREFTQTLNGMKLPEGLQTGPTPRQPSIEEVLKQHPFLQSNPSQPTKLIVTQGTWDVEGDLIMPNDTDLIVPAGTTLRFSEGSILYTNGPIFLLGKPEAPILLTAQKDTWGGIVVLSTPRDSLWQYAGVEKTAGISREGWTLTGGITFFQSTIVLDHTLLGNNKTEDAINVIHGTFKFSDCEFANTQADALDSDFSTGEINNCYFHDIAGDAVDVSGTKATVNNSRMERVTDKGVSVGEQSDITVENTKMDTVGIGVASKDLSKAVVSNTEIRQARFSALAAYIKKPVYGPAQIDARNLTVLDTGKAAVVQKGSTILIDGKPVEAVDLDVEQLYKEGILGN